MLPKNLRGKGSKTIPIFVENALQTMLLKQWNPNAEVEPFLETNPIKAKFGKSPCVSLSFLRRQESRFSDMFGFRIGLVLSGAWMRNDKEEDRNSRN